MGWLRVGGRNAGGSLKRGHRSPGIKASGDAAAQRLETGPLGSDRVGDGAWSGRRRSVRSCGRASRIDPAEGEGKPPTDPWGSS